MPNGRPGDNPITDIIVHDLPTFDREIDQLVKEIAEVAQVRAFRRVERLMFDAQQAPELRPKLKRKLERLRNKLEYGTWSIG
jgi:hypothetical protein